MHFPDAGAGSPNPERWAPTCKRIVGLAMVGSPHFRMGSKIWAEIYLHRELAWERRMSRVRAVQRLFFAPARRRAMPPAGF
jgi:aminomethyltransferase